MFTQPEKDLIFSLTTDKKNEILGNESQSRPLLDLLRRLYSIGEGSTAHLLFCILPNIEDAKDFIFMADSLEEATGALKCWAYAKDLHPDTEGDVRWSEIAQTLWQG